MPPPAKKQKDYKSERFDPTLEQCSKLSILFDGKTLTLQGGTSDYTYPAVSGKPAKDGTFNYSPARQKSPNAGPIPEGTYWINPDEIWTLRWYNFWTPQDGWGEYRVTIRPRTATVTHGRGGFFIHGGKVAGSAGCIDLTSEITRFVNDLDKEGARRKCQIPVVVKYDSEKK